MRAFTNAANDYLAVSILGNVRCQCTVCQRSFVGVLGLIMGSRLSWLTFCPFFRFRYIGTPEAKQGVRI